VVGRVLGAWGIRGDVTVEPHSDVPERFSPGSLLYMNGSPTRVLMSRPHKGRLVVRLDHVADRTEAESLRGASLAVPGEQVGPLPEGSYYHFEILGLGVWTDDGEHLGKVHEILATGSNDVYVVQDSDGQQLLVPALGDVVVSIAPEQGRMVVRLPEGLR